VLAEKKLIRKLKAIIMVAFFLLGDGNHVFPVPQNGCIIPSLHDLNLKYEFEVYAVVVGLSNLVLISIEYLRVLTTFLLVSTWNSFSQALNLASNFFMGLDLER